MISLLWGMHPGWVEPVVYGHDDRLEIVKTITELLPDPESHWTVRAVADELATDLGGRVEFFV